MKPLGPMATLTLAPLLTGIVVATIAAIVQPDTRTAWGLGVSFGAGAILGILISGPIALGEGCRSLVARSLGHHAFRVQWLMSFAMALAIGYLAASMRYQACDWTAGVAVGVVMLGAMGKTVIGTALTAT